ncbi:hypothetical protein ACQP1V_25510 [Microtetraspora malaysiensis]|uniref:hypothetical protein n=1 Tax=Microtetraspora malaysiensis TaxID=161358 RepID=UPI003D8F9331
MNPIAESGSRCRPSAAPGGSPGAAGQRVEPGGGWSRRLALTVAEHLAFVLGRYVLVVPADMPS